MKSTLSILVAASALAMLAACGGGGGDDSPTSKSVAITSANQTAVARASLSGGTAVALAQGSLGAGGTSGTLAVHTLARRVIAAVTNQRKAVASAGVHATTTNTTTDTCQVSGSITVTLDDRDGSGTLSNGDVITASFAQCKDSDTSSINGAIAITLTATPTDSAFDASANFQNVAVVSGSLSSSVSGVVALHEVDGVTVSTSRLTVGSGGLTASVTSPSYTDSVSFESGMTFATSATADTISESLDGSFTASSIGGRVTVSTQSPLTSSLDSDYPSAGVVKIVGASGSTVLATVLDATQVQLQLDANGDGTYESTTDVPWATLMP